jgi:hypothetical protein
MDDDAFTGIIGGNPMNLQSFEGSSDDEDLNFYKEKYSRLLEANGEGMVDFDSDEGIEKLSSFNFIPSLKL